MTKQELSDTDKAFYQDGQRLGEAAISDKPEPQKLWQATRQEQDAMEGLIDALSAEAKRKQIKIDCRKGCSWCCYQPIYGVAHEFHYLWKFMLLNMSEDERKSVIQKAFDNYQKRGRLSQDQLEKSKLPCPLLKNGACSAYQARPMACRIYLSMSETSCKQFHDHPEDDKNYPALLEFPLRAGQMMNEGFSEALKPAKLINNEFLMEEGLLIAYNNGEPFDGDLHNHPLFKKHD